MLCRTGGLKGLFISGYAEHTELQSENLEPGMQVLTKPFSIEKLPVRIKGMIDGG